MTIPTTPTTQSFIMLSKTTSQLFLEQRNLRNKESILFKLRL